MDNHGGFRSQNKRLCLYRGMEMAKLILASKACDLGICKLTGKSEVNRKTVLLLQQTSVLSEFPVFHEYVPGWSLGKGTWAQNTCRVCSALWLTAGRNLLLTAILSVSAKARVEFPSSGTSEDPGYLFWKWSYAFVHESNIPLTIALTFWGLIKPF